jgi:hypothetical protein
MPAEGAPGRRRRWAVIAAAAVAVGAGIGVWLAGERRDDGAAQARAAPGSTASAPALSATAAASAAPYSAAGLAARAEQLALWRQRLERAQEALAAYRKSTRYPHGSRPAAEQPDQMRPNDPIVEDHPLREPGSGPGPDDVRLRTVQERVHALASERVRFSVAVVDAQGRPQPLRVLTASVREFTPPTVASLFPVQPVTFVDDGSGVHSAVLQPAEQGYAGLAGQLRLEVALEHRGRRGFTYFDLYVTPDAPAVWSGPVRDAVEAGALVFVLPAQVREAGRYVVTGRVDDASGQPLALLTFNDEAGAGATEFRLQLHGRLLHDARPAFPLTLRDVEAFRLQEQGHPDRLLMPRRAGPVHASDRHALTAFSPAEWASEERTRYLSELTRDVDEARAKLEQLRGAPP